MKSDIESKNKTSSALYCVVIGTFFAVLVIFLVGGLILPDKTYSETENRNLSAFPSFSVENILSGNFMNKFESYLSDQFVNRDTVVALKTAMSYALGNREVNDVYIGKSNRLYEVPSVYNENDVKTKIEAVNAFSEKFDVENKYFILVPNALHIIPENLPPLLKCEDQSLHINKIYSMLNKDFFCVDSAAVLSQAENRESLYLRTDHHWTADAAKVVFDEFSRCADLDCSDITYKYVDISNSFSGTLASSSGIDDFTDNLSAVVPEGIEGTFIVHNYETQEKKSTFFDLEKLNTKNQYEVFFGGNFSRIRIYTKNVNAKNLLIFKDSYANCFIPMLIPHYENIVVIDPRYFSGRIEDIMADFNFTDVLFLYNLNTFLEDTSLAEIFS